jgi:hypothetical protein
MDIRAIGWRARILQITAFAGASFYSLGPGLGKRGWRGIFGAKRAGGRDRLSAYGRPHRGEGAHIRGRQVRLSRLWLAVKTSQRGRAGCRQVPDQIAGTAFDFSADCCESRAVPGGNLPIPIGHAMLMPNEKQGSGGCQACRISRAQRSPASGEIFK